MGSIVMPLGQLGKLSSEFVVLELNSYQPFDFEYEPQENDGLKIECLDRERTSENSFRRSKYLSFHFSKGKWRLGGVSPFTYELEKFKEGTIRLEQNGPESKHRFPSVRFCNKPEQKSPLPKAGGPEYSWAIERLLDPQNPDLDIQINLPAEQLDDLLPEFIVLELNTKNLFDIEYEPQEGDFLSITRTNGDPMDKPEGPNGAHLVFEYYNGRWVVGSGVSCGPMEPYQDGVVRVL